MAAAVTFTATHTIAGTTYDGKKIVFTNLVPDTGTTVGTATISPLKQVYSWVLSVKDPGTTPRTFEATLTGNIISITPSGDATGGVLEVMSIGV